MSVRLEFKKGTKGKKYKVHVYKNNKKIKSVSFGSSAHAQYRDSTPLKLYASKDHMDPKRKRAYIARHNYKIKRYTPGYFSRKYLWT